MNDPYKHFSDVAGITPLFAFAIVAAIAFGWAVYSLTKQNPE